MNYKITRFLQYSVARGFILASALVWCAMPVGLVGAAAPAPVLNIPARWDAVAGQWVAAVPQPPQAPGLMNYLRTGIASTGSIVLAPFATLGSVAGVTYKAMGALEGIASSMLSLAMGHPLTATGVAMYGLLADDGKGLKVVTSVCDDLGKKAYDNGLVVIQAGTADVVQGIGARAYDHLYRNRRLAVAIVVPLVVIKSWDAVLGKNGSLVLDGLFGSMVVVPSDGMSGLPLANFMYDVAPDATILYHQLLDGDATLRSALMLALRKGSINNWKIDSGNVQARILEQIDIEMKRIATMQLRVEFYVPNAQAMLKEARKCAGISTNQRHHSTAEKEQKYWDMILEWMKDPHHAKAKPNTWMVPMQKSLEGVITNFEFKMPNIFWHIYPYYGQALLLYACLEQRKERLIALRELIEQELSLWLKEDAALWSQDFTVYISRSPKTT